MERTKENFSVTEANGKRPSSSVSRRFSLQGRPPQQTNSKVSEALSWLRSRRVSMKTPFRLFGGFIGSWPVPCLVAFCIILSFSAFVCKVELRDRVRDGYTPRASRAREEQNTFRRFYSSTGDPAMTTVILTAYDKSSMIEERNLREAVEVLQDVKSRIRVPLVDEGGEITRETRRYDQMCSHYCDANAIIDYFYILKLAITKKRRDPSLKDLQLTYPIAKMESFDFHLERNFNGVTVGTLNGNVTNIDHCKLIILTFTADVGSTAEEELLARWELAVFDYANQRPNTSYVEMLVIGAEIVDSEINKDSRKMAPYFVTGSVSAVLAIFTTGWWILFQTGRLSGKTRSRTVMNLFLPLFVCLVPVFAILNTFGIFGMFHLRVNSLMMIMPFLIMGVGVNDAFLLVSHHVCLPTTKSRKEIIAEYCGVAMISLIITMCRTINFKPLQVFEEVGPSITMTTMTNVISFSIGSFMDTEEIALFCRGCALAMFFAYLYTLLFFGAILSFYTPLDGQPQPVLHSVAQSTRHFFKRILKTYTRLLMFNPFRLLMMGIYAGYMYLAVYGTLSITSKLDTEKILPKDTPIHRPNRIIESIVWAEYYPVIVMVNSPFEISNSTQTKMFYEMVSEFESMPKCRGKQFSMLWTREYEAYFDFVAQGNTDFFDTPEDEEAPEVGKYTSSQLRGFLSSPLTKHFSAFVHTNYSLSPVVRNFSFVVVYENNTSWDDRIELHQGWRRIVDKYPALSASIWNVNGMFVDQMLSLKDVAIHSGMLTLGCMAIVCLAFIQKIALVFVATSAIGSIAIGCIGCLGHWGLDLDPVTICAILIAIGMSVDNTAHVSIFFVSTPPRPSGRKPKVVDRLEYAIGSVFYPSFQGNLSTLICVMPLIMINNYIPLVFVKTIVLVVLIGFIHGVILIPMTLAMLPQSLLDFDLLTRMTMGAYPSPTTPPQPQLQLKFKENPSMQVGLLGYEENKSSVAQTTKVPKEFSESDDLLQKEHEDSSGQFVRF